jgi:16S rRNA (adenine(1408)-N(1))-methyltransferase
MQCVRGKALYEMQRSEIVAWASRFPHVMLDLGTGDGRYVRDVARQEPLTGVIGVDLCAANLRQSSRVAAGNALFVVADALALPNELRGLADRVTIHFPWGSLLRGLLQGEDRLLAGLMMAGKDDMAIEIALNAGALAEEGCLLEEGSARVIAALRDTGLCVSEVARLDAEALRRWPTSWAKRLAYGREPRAIVINAQRLLTSVLCPPSSVSPVLQLSVGRHDAGMMNM